MPTVSRWQQRVEVLIHAARNLWLQPLMSILSLLTISFALLVFGGYLLITENIRGAIVSAAHDRVVSVYLKGDLAEEAREALSKKLSTDPLVAEVAYWDKDRALAEFRASLKDDSIRLMGVDANNPLPASFEVSFARGALTRDGIEAFVRKYRALDEVEYIHYSKALVDEAATLIAFIRAIGLAGLIFLLLVTSWIIANTIQISLFGRREEIQLLKLVGATNSYIRAPYLVEGVLAGLIGGGVALTLLYLGYFIFGSIVDRSGYLAPLFSQFVFLSLPAVCAILVTGALVGLLGSFFAVRRLADA